MQVLSSEIESQTYGQQLERIRRLDWRFLLPDPNPDKIIYLGSADDALFTELRNLYKNVVIPHSSGLKPPTAAGDLVVIPEASVQGPGTAWPYLRAGGHLYWEVSRHSPNGNGAATVGLRGLEYRRFADSLANHGFEDIRAYWHRPSLEKCLDIVPLNDATALAYFFSREREDLPGKLKIWLGRMLNAAGMLGYVISGVSFVARKPR